LESVLVSDSVLEQVLVPVEVVVAVAVAVEELSLYPWSN
jgi:hypothetical protein